MAESLLTGMVIRVTVGPAFNNTRIKDLDAHIEKAWREAERKSYPCT